MHEKLQQSLERNKKVYILIYRAVTDSYNQQKDFVR